MAETEAELYEAQNEAPELHVAKKGQAQGRKHFLAELAHDVLHVEESIPEEFTRQEARKPEKKGHEKTEVDISGQPEEKETGSKLVRALAARAKSRGGSKKIEQATPAERTGEAQAEPLRALDAKSKAAGRVRATAKEVENTAIPSGLRAVASDKLSISKRGETVHLIREGGKQAKAPSAGLAGSRRDELIYDDRLAKKQGHPIPDGQPLEGRRRLGMAKAGRKLRSLVRPARKRLSPALKKILLAVSLLILLAVLVWVSAFTGVLNVKHIAISGNQRLDADYLRALSGITPDTHLLKMNVKAVEQAILSDPYVAGAHISRRLPNTVAIAITERQPEGIIFQNGSYYLVDPDGWVLESVDKKPAGLVEIQGVDVPLMFAGQRIDTETFAAVTALIQSMPDQLKGMTVYAGCRQPEGLYAQARGTKLIYGDSSDLAKKSDIALLALTDLANRYQAVDYIDVSFPEHPVIKPIN